MVFQYTAIDATGKKLKGELDAQSEALALDDLAKRGMTVLEIAMRNVSSVRKSTGKAKRRDLVAFMRELATLVSSGVSLDEALQTLHGANPSGPLASALQAMTTSIHAGEKFSDALARAGLDLPSYAHALTSAGEATGNLGFALTRCADQMEFDAKLREEATSALVYPTILIVVGLAAVLFIFSFVVPKFAKMLEGKRADLPWISDKVMSIGMFVNQHTLLTLGAFAGLVFGLYALYKSGALTSFARSLPGISVWFTSGDTARWTSTLAVLVQNKVPILNAIELTARASTVPEVSRKLAFLQADVRQGVPLSSSMEQHQVLDASSLSMVKVGERSGELGKMLGHISHYWSERNTTMQKRMVTLIEPISIVLLGGVVGVVMVAIIMAITSLSEVKL
jgi:general secretion pathway protein F